MNRFLKLSFSIMISAGILLTVALLAAEAEKKPEVKVPEGVLAAFHKSYPDVKVSGYDMEEADGKKIFEIETIVDEMEKTYVYSENAALVQIEEEVKTSALPEIVLSSINKAHPKFEIDEADKITRGLVIEYEVVIEADEEEIEILVAADGSFISTAGIDDDDEEDDGGEDEDDDKDDDNDKDDE